MFKQGDQNIGQEDEVPPQAEAGKGLRRGQDKYISLRNAILSEDLLLEFTQLRIIFHHMSQKYPSL